jgi:hypothetical protein
LRDPDCAAYEAMTENIAMIRIGLASLALVAAATASRGAERLIEPGQWKVTSSTVVNGMVQPPQPKLRCITPEQADDLASTFGPVSSTINSTCADPQVETSGRTLSWHLQCRGQLDADVAGHFDFDSPQHYKATVTSKAAMGGTLMSDVKTELQGERVGDCQQ